MAANNGAGGRQGGNNQMNEHVEFSVRLKSDGSAISVDILPRSTKIDLLVFAERCPFQSSRFHSSFFLVVLNALSSPLSCYE